MYNYIIDHQCKFERLKAGLIIIIIITSSNNDYKHNYGGSGHVHVSNEMWKETWQKLSRYNRQCLHVCLNTKTSQSKS